MLSLREDDVFLQMTVISATLLRKTTPKCKIVILIDEHTELNKYPLEYQLLLDLQVEVVTIPTGYSNCVLSSRFIKLSLPYIINEKFWYLDADTLPIVSVVDPEVIWDIAMVRDLNMNRSHYLLGESRSNNCDVMGWPKPKYPYYNSGVIFANCNSRVKDLFDHAKDLWLSALERGVNCGDQLPLNIAMQNYTKISSLLLDDSFNAQIRASPSSAYTAKILHIFSDSIEKHNDTVLHTLVSGLREQSTLRSDIIDTLLTSKNPWVKGSNRARLFPIRRLLSKLTC